MAKLYLRPIVARWLGEGLKARGLNPTSLEALSGIRRQTVMDLLKGRADARESTIETLARFIGPPPEIAEAPVQGETPAAALRRMARELEELANRMEALDVPTAGGVADSPAVRAARSARNVGGSSADQGTGSP